MYPFNQLSQAFPPKPDFTEEHIPNLAGKVYIVTGSNTGVGAEVARILHSKHASVYVAARSEPKALAAIESIRSANPDSPGTLTFLKLDLADLSTIRSSAQFFLDRESRLDVLFNNAGVMMPTGEDNKLTPQGYDMQLGVNNLGTFLFTKLLTPTLVNTAKTEAPGNVRVVWVSSSAAEAPIVPNGGVNMGDIDRRADKPSFYCYAASKAGNYLHGVEYARRYKEAGIVSIPLNPGNLSSDLWRWSGSIVKKLLNSIVLHPPINGAYTELFAGVSPSVTIAESGKWVGPWGRFLPVRKDLEASIKSKEEGGRDTAKAFWQWTEEKVKEFE